MDATVRLLNQTLNFTPEWLSVSVETSSCIAWLLSTRHDAKRKRFQHSRLSWRRLITACPKIRYNRCTAFSAGMIHQSFKTSLATRAQPAAMCVCTGPAQGCRSNERQPCLASRGQLHCRPERLQRRAVLLGSIALPALLPARFRLQELCSIAELPPGMPALACSQLPETTREGQSSQLRACMHARRLRGLCR